MNQIPSVGCAIVSRPLFRIPKMMSTGINPSKKPTGFCVVGKTHSDSNGHTKEGDNSLLGMGECGVCGDNCGDCTY